MESITSVNPSEYAPFYETYVRRVPEGEISEILSDQIDDTLSLLNAVPAELETYRYGTGKWWATSSMSNVSSAFVHWPLLAETARLCLAWIKCSMR